MMPTVANVATSTPAMPTSCEWTPTDQSVTPLANLGVCQSTRPYTTTFVVADDSCTTLTSATCILPDASGAINCMVVVTPPPAAAGVCKKVTGSTSLVECPTMMTEPTCLPVADCYWKPEDNTVTPPAPTSVGGMCL